MWRQLTELFSGVQRNWLTKGLLTLALVLGAVSFGLSGALHAFADKPATLIMFTADWCASCRDVLPVVQTYASGKGYSLQIIDVDAANAEALSRQYGLSLRAVAPPMVYFVGAGKQVLVVDDNVDASRTADTLKQKLP
jgi:thiol-disulfide isomerase/thioredoxin